MTDILLSIIIPTKNRINYLYGALNVINSYNNDKIEVIIQDNSDNNTEVEEMVLSFHNNNFKYFYQPGKLSQTENSDLSMSHVSGKYVTYIGDDDTICASLVDLAMIMDKYKIDSCSYNVASYNWPDLVEQVPNLYYFSSPCIKTCLKKINTKKHLKKELKNGVQSIDLLPRVYHGIVSKKIIDTIYKNCGSYFPGPSPDMANAISCSIYVTSQYYIDFPMIISGFGKSSAGGMGKRKLHKGTLKGNFQLKDDVEDKWNNKIPKLWMQSTVWPESAYEALLANNQNELALKINYGYVYAEVFLHDRSSIKAILNCKPSIIECVLLFSRLFIRTFKRLFNFKKNKCSIFYEKISIEEAARIQNMKNSNYDINKIFKNFMKII